MSTPPSSWTRMRAGPETGFSRKNSVSKKRLSTLFRWPIHIRHGGLAVVLAACALALLLGWLAAQAAPTQVAGQAEAVCTFRAISVTGANLRLLDTQPETALDRVLYFAQAGVAPGDLTLSIVLTGFPSNSPCYLWSSPAFDRPDWLLRTLFEATPTTALDYTVSATHTASTIKLVASENLSGSMLLTAGAWLTFTQDISPPVSAVTSPLRSVAAGDLIPLNWQAADAGSGVLSATLYYTDTRGNTGLRELASPSGAMAFDPQAGGLTTPITYFFSTQATDRLLNQERQTAEIWVVVQGRRVYLPLIMRNLPPLPIPTPGSLIIAGGADHVYSTSVTLALSSTVTGGLDTVAWVRLSNEGITWDESDWQPFSSNLAWQLADGGSDLRTVYAQFKNLLGGVSSPPVSDTIYLALNGDMEYGNFAPAWQVGENPLPASLVQAIQERDGGVTPPAGGSYAALLGGLDYPCQFGVPQGHAGITQTFNLPPQPASLLTFSYIIWSQDTSIIEQYDRFEVHVNDGLAFSDGNQVNAGLSCERWWRVPGVDNPRVGQTTGWARGSIDLSPYAGQAVVVSFRNYNRFDNNYNTYTYLDSVAIEPMPGDW
ncbi:MAG: hypothetical protein JW850_01410 [Thermoflexales bacterium]|nr:hypothetical protein [Thermoflexales bacterium]